MKRKETDPMRLVAPVTIALLAALGLVISHPSLAQNPMGDPNAEPAPFNPQMSALMSMLIQPRHAKLGLAGKAENWALAGYAFKELKQGVAVVSRAVPRWKSLPLPGLFDAALSPSFAVLGFGIKAREPHQVG